MSIDKNSFPKVIDTDSPYDDNKNAADAKNVTYIGNDSRNVGHAMPILGNRPAFDMGSVSQQNKIYRVYIGNTYTIAYTLEFRATNNSYLLFSSIIPDYIPAAATQIQIDAAASGNAAIITQNIAEGYFDIQLIPVPNIQAYRWFLTNDTNANNQAAIEVRQEAIEPLLAGELVDIGGFDLLGDLFIWSTSQRNLPTTTSINIINAFAPSPVSPIRIVCDPLTPHGLITNQWVSITGVEGMTNANGEWSVSVIDAFTFVLVQSLPNPFPAVYTGGGQLTIYPSGIGEIGVAQKDAITQNWVYYRLLRSVELNFVTIKQIDTHCERNAFKSSLYWTDDYNPPRVAYSEGAFVQDGMLSINGGLYEYGTIYQETILNLMSSSTYLTFSQQLQNGGALISGNKTYAIRLLTDGLAATDWSPPISPIPVYGADEGGSAYQLLGDPTGTTTTKVNVFTVTGIPSGVYKYIELACTEYVGIALNSYIVRRELILTGSMELQHTGFELYTAIVSGEIGLIRASIRLAKNIRAIDNRLIISNIVESSELNLLGWSQTITHGIFKKTIAGWGYLSAVAGEYQVVSNCHNFVGYMINETYRMGVRVLFKTGQWSRVYFVQDIRIDNDVAYPRRTQALSNYDLSANSGADVFIPYLEFGNINLDYSVEGIPLHQLIDAISFVRVELTNLTSEVVASGAIVVSQTHFNPSGFAGALFHIDLTPQDGLYIPTSNNALDEWVGVSGILLTDTDTDPLNNPISSPPLGFVVNSKYASFYAPDILYRHTIAEQLSGQELIVFGAMTGGASVNGANIAWQPSYYRDYFVENMVIPISYQAEELLNIPMFGSASFVNGSQVFNKFYDGHIALNSTSPVFNIPVPMAYGITGSPVIELNAPIVNNNANVDFGIYYGQLYNAKPNKFPAVENTIYTNIGHELPAGGLVGVLNGVAVFGGDAMTERTYFKERYINQTVTPVLQSMVSDGVVWNNLGGGSGFIIFSQNRINSQLRYDATGEYLFPYDTQNPFQWLEQTDASADQFSYDEGYTPRNSVATYAALDINTRDVFDLPTRIRWSELKPQDSITDTYRLFLALNFKDLDNSFGEINHHENVNGELFTLQPKKWQRQFFNTRGTLQVQNISDVLIGDGSVMSRDGQTISNFGTQNKWGVILGKSKGGNDVIFWWDGINKMFMRFGGDGTLSISEIKGMENFAANNLNWVAPNDTPADGEGIHGVWHQRMGEAIWFVRGKRGAVPTPTPASGINPFLMLEYLAYGVPMIWEVYQYPQNSIVYYKPTTFPLANAFVNFEQTGEFWRSLIHNNTTTPSLTNLNWEVIPHTDTNYYSEFSIAFNEKLNEVTQAKTPSGFSSFYTPLPMIAHEWTNGYVSPRPISPLSKHYEHNRGAYLTWYEHNGVSQTEEGYVELVINKDTDMPMLYQALVVNADSRPYKISFYTQGQETFIVAADFEVMNGVWQAAIKNDITGVVVQPVNEQDTSQMFGTYIRVRFYFEVDKFNAINDFIVKFIALHRNYQS